MTYRGFQGQGCWVLRDTESEVSAELPAFLGKGSRAGFMELSGNGCLKSPHIIMRCHYRAEIRCHFPLRSLDAQNAPGEQGRCLSPFPWASPSPFPPEGQSGISSWDCQVWPAGALVREGREQSCWKTGRSSVEKVLQEPLGPLVPWTQDGSPIYNGDSPHPSAPLFTSREGLTACVFAVPLPAGLRRSPRQRLWNPQAAPGSLFHSPLTFVDGTRSSGRASMLRLDNT